MALETANFINQLIATNPTGADPKGQGDDHLRLLKRVLQSQFPNLSSAVTTTAEQLNQLTVPNSLVFPGMIVMWSGSIGALPAGWLLCNGVGTISTGAPVPDLRDRFPVGAGLSYGVGSFGGTTSHFHPTNVTVNPTALTIANLPPHTHSYALGSNDTTGTGWTQAAPGNTGGANTPAYTLQTGSAGSGTGHAHTTSVTMSPVDHRPPYYGLAFIIKS